MDSPLLQLGVYLAEKYRHMSPDLDRRVELESCQFVNMTNDIFAPEVAPKIQVQIHGNRAVERFRFTVTIHRIDGTALGVAFSDDNLSIEQGESAVFEIVLNDARLMQGSYYCTLSVGTGDHLTRYRDFDLVTDVLHFQLGAPTASNNITGVWYSEWGSMLFPVPEVSRIA